MASGARSETPRAADSDEKRFEDQEAARCVVNVGDRKAELSLHDAVRSRIQYNDPKMGLIKAKKSHVVPGVKSHELLTLMKIQLRSGRWPVVLARYESEKLNYCRLMRIVIASCIIIRKLLQNMPESGRL